MTSSTSAATNPWEIVAYEARMLFDLCRAINDEAFDRFPKIIKNALVESACLHTRILVDILLSKDSGKGDDIRLNQLLPAFSHPSVDRLKSAYGDGRSPQPQPPWPCWTLNKMIAHPTLKRGSSHDYTSTIKMLLPLIEAVWREIEKYHQLLLSKMARPVGELDLRFCAKTSS